MFKKNNLDFEISRTIALIFLLLNKFEKSLTFIVIQMYNFVIDNINTNTFRTNLLDNINNLDLLDITLVNNYNLNTKLENFII